jgi:hypothetical protein
MCAPQISLYCQPGCSCQQAQANGCARGGCQPLLCGCSCSSGCCRRMVCSASVPSFTHGRSSNLNLAVGALCAWARTVAAAGKIFWLGPRVCQVRLLHNIRCTRLNELWLDLECLRLCWGRTCTLDVRSIGLNWRIEQHLHWTQSM